MKKIILISILLIILLFSIVIASEDTFDENQAVLGNEKWGLVYDDLSFFDKLSVGGLLGTQTVVNNAVCSLYPDREYSYSPSSSSITKYCYTNTLHTGTAWQLFDQTDGKWNYLGELQNDKGEKTCFDVAYGKSYYVTFYYCDATTTRTCVDSDGGQNFYTKGSVTFTLDGKSTTIFDKCWNDGLLGEEYCVDNSVVSTTSACQCLDGKCISNLEPPSDNGDTGTGDTGEGSSASSDKGNFFNQTLFGNFQMWQVLLLGFALLGIGVIAVRYIL
jgi:hypothetical protein